MADSRIMEALKERVGGSVASVVRSRKEPSVATAGRFKVDHVRARAGLVHEAGC